MFSKSLAVHLEMFSDAISAQASGHVTALNVEEGSLQSGAFLATAPGHTVSVRLAHPHLMSPIFGPITKPLREPRTNPAVRQELWLALDLVFSGYRWRGGLHMIPFHLLRSRGVTVYSRLLGPSSGTPSPSNDSLV